MFFDYVYVTFSIDGKVIYSNISKIFRETPRTPGGLSGGKNNPE